ncbi:hypothetical protein FOMPIDRAFT_126692 [Fomitopsis schrenkii]|uniref:Cora-domain-containing protein n=1 Tax=Fomitopsis schrenkii TaxID=2126942 RepID=S8EEI3_FOMSC|nr:hypothetical protein FOMPIDRAFT_126692 [Fomitopsis schrenkii]
MSPSISSGSSEDTSAIPRLEYGEETQSCSSGLEGSLSVVANEVKAGPPSIEIGTPTSPVKELRSPIALRFRSAVHRLIAVRRASVYLASGHIGAEPGIDPRRASANSHYGHIRQQCVIEIVDYSVTKCSVGRMTNRQLVQMLASPEASKREPWARVRWINVGGVSWDVLSALAIRYDMHPLAIEDVIHHHGSSARSKADYYPQHLFLRILCHRLASEGDWDIASEVLDDPDDSEVDGMPRSESPEPMEDSDYEKTRQDRRSRTARRFKSMNRLSEDDRVSVKINPVCIFLFRDGTVISVSQESNLDFTTPIRERLRQFDTGLRKTADPSLLVQSLIDLIVDQALEVVEEYQGTILKLERDVLVRPNMKTVTALHMIQGDLNMHKRTLEPIKTLVYGLRRYDIDRASAMLASEGKVWDAVAKPVGFMSEKAKTYLADVHDHMEYILMSLDMFAGVSDNLINYTCNMVSYEMNEGMRQLTLITVIFLPLTFLSGYFGMNFVRFWAVDDDNHSDLLFWEIAIPIMIIVIPLFLWPDLKRYGQNIQSHFMQRRIKKVAKTRT